MAIIGAIITASHNEKPTTRLIKEDLLLMMYLLNK